MATPKKQDKKPAVWTGFLSFGIFIFLFGIVFGHDNTETFFAFGNEWFLFDWVEFIGVVLIGLGALFYGIALVSRIKHKATSEAPAPVVGIKDPAKHAFSRMASDLTVKKPSKK